MSIGTAQPATRAARVPVVALLGADAISMVGNQLTALAIPWFVLQTTGSATRTGLVAFFTVLPTVLAAFLGGAVADRLGHKRTSVLADVLSGTTVALVPLLYHTVGLPFGALLGLVFLGALLDTPGGTARAALLPDAAGRAGIRLERVNGTSQAIRSLSGLLGPPLAGLLIVVVGASNVLWLDAATFGVSAAVIGLAVTTPRVAVVERGSYRDEVLAGLRFLGGDRLLRALAITAAVLNFLATPLGAVVFPVYALEVFGRDGAGELGVALAGEGIGALVAALLYGAIGHRLPRRATLLGGLVVASVPMGILAATPPLAGTTAALVVLGLATGMANPLLGTVLQERVPPELRARVFGAVLASALVAAPLGMLLVGPLLEALGLRAVLLIIAAGFGVTTLSMLVNPALREMDPPTADAAAEA